MPDLETIIAFENGELDEDAVIEFIQSGIDAGWVWRLQGSYGRLASMLIQSGQCYAPSNQH